MNEEYKLQDIKLELNKTKNLPLKVEDPYAKALFQELELNALTDGNTQLNALLGFLGDNNIKWNVLVRSEGENEYKRIYPLSL